MAPFTHRLSRLLIVENLPRISLNLDLTEGTKKCRVGQAAICAADDDPRLEIALRALARLRAAVGPARVARSLAAALGVSEAEVEALLAEVGGTTPD